MTFFATLTNPSSVTQVRRASFLAVVLSVLFLAVGCNSSRKQIAGKWQVEGGSNAVTWEFQPNGVVNMGATEGRYTFGDQERIKIQMPAAVFVYEMELKDNVMTWRAPNGTSTTLKRVP